MMLFDRSNHENLKFNLEKSYHKSIVEAHAQQSAEINVVSTLNLFYIEDVECNAAASATGEYEITNTVNFDKFSLIKPRLCKPPNANSHINEISTSFLPIGRYFVRIRYRRVLYTSESQLDVMLNASSLEKESIADLSLLPLAIRAQIIYEHSAAMIRCSGGRGSYSMRPRSINALAIDSHLLQIEINKKRDELIKEAIIRSSNPLDTEALLLSAATKTSPELDEFIKTLEVDLNSYYICEKLPYDDSSSHAATAALKDVDLVKLNRLDALASFKCVQKYRNLLWNVILADKVRKSVSRSASTINRYLRFLKF